MVEEKSRVGDWEVDTIIGAKHQGALVSVVDRASKFTFLEHVTGKTAVAVGDAIRRCLMPVLALVHTITADNGKEFAGHQLLAKTLSALFFFATPYHSWGARAERTHQRPCPSVFPEVDGFQDARSRRGQAGTGVAQ